MQTNLLEKYPSLASVPSQKKALEYLEKISNQANIDISKINILKVFADPKSSKKIVIDVKELNKRLFQYAEKTKAASKKEFIQEAEFVMKQKKVVAKGIREQILATVADGFWRLVDVTQTHVKFANRNDLMLRDPDDDKIYNLGIILIEISKKSLIPAIRPFANNRTDDMGVGDEEWQPIHPYDLNPDICFGNSYSYYNAARKTKKMSEVMKIVQVVLSVFSEEGGPNVSLYNFTSSYDYSYLYEDDGGEVPNMTPEADRFYEMIEATKKVQKTIKAPKSKVKTTKTVVNFHDSYEDEEDEVY